MALSEPQVLVNSGNRTFGSQCPVTRRIRSWQETVLQAFLCVFWRIPGWERLPGFTDLEQTSQALIQAFDGSKKIPSPGGCFGHFMGVQIRGQRLAELGGAANTLLGWQGAHRGGTLFVGLSLLQFFP